MSWKITGKTYGTLIFGLLVSHLSLVSAEPSRWFEDIKQWDYYLGAGLGWGQHDRFNARSEIENFQYGNAGFTTTITSTFSGDQEKKDKAWRVVGGTWFHEHFGVEFGYLDLGKTTLDQSAVTTTRNVPMFGSPLVFLAPTPGVITTEGNLTSSVEITGVSMLAKTRHPITKYLDLTVSLGAVRWDKDERLNTTLTRQVSGPISVFFPAATTITTTPESIDDDGFDLAYGVGLRARVSESVQLGFEWTRYEADRLDSHVDFIGVNAEYHFDFSSSDSNVSSRYAATANSSFGGMKNLWPFNTTAVKIPQWEYFGGLSAGIAEHNVLGEQDDEDAVVTSNVLPGGTILTSSIVTSLDEDAAAWRVNVGAYVSKYLGFEFAYADFGRVSTRTTIMSRAVTPAVVFNGFTFFPETIRESGSSFRADAEISSYSLSALFRHPITKRVELGAKLGASIWDADGKAITETSGFSGIFIPRGTGMTPSLTIENSDHGIDVTYGASAKFNAYKNLWIGLDYSHYEVGESDQDIDYLALSVEYRFGKLM